jgi:hypothetical protein
MIGDLAAALRQTLARPGQWLALTAALIGWVALFFWWLGLPVGSGGALVLLACTGVLLLASAGAILAWPFAKSTPRPGFRCLRAGAPWVALAVLGAAGLYLPVRMIHWVPELDSMAMRFISAGCRFLISAALFAGTLIFLSQCCSVSAGKEPE